MDDQMVQPQMGQPDGIPTIEILSTDRTGPNAIVRIVGELDAHSTPAVDNEVARLLGDGVSDLVLDLSQTSFIDSFGLRALLSAEGECAKRDTRFALDAPSKAVQRLLDIAGLTDHFVVES